MNMEIRDMENDEETERKLVTIRRITGVESIEGADRIEVVKLDGWRCVTQKSNGFQAGDRVIYVEIDSFVPVDREPFKWLEKNKITWNDKEGARIKSIRLRNVLSQGLVLSLKECFEIVERDGIEYINMTEYYNSTRSQDENIQNNK